MLRCHSQLLLSLCTVQCYNVPRYRLHTRGEDEPAAAVPRQAAPALQRQEAAPERGRPPLRRGQCRAQPARAAGHQGGSHTKKYYPLATTCKNITCIKNISDLQHHSELDTAPSQLGSLGRLVSRHTSLVTVPEPRPAPAPAPVPPSRSFSLCHSNKYKVSGRHLPQHLVHLSYLHFLARSDLLAVTRAACFSCSRAAPC